MEDVITKANREIRTYERVGLRTTQELCSEIERLRGAFLRISFLPQDDPAEWVEQAMEIVDAALAGKEEKKP